MLTPPLKYADVIITQHHYTPHPSPDYFIKPFIGIKKFNRIQLRNKFCAAVCRFSLGKCAKCFLSVSSDKLFVLQLAVWSLRGVSRVIYVNNPLSGALILAALYWASPWQGLLAVLGVLASTLTAVIIGQDR